MRGWGRGAASKAAPDGFLGAKQVPSPETLSHASPKVTGLSPEGGKLQSDFI
ncbi:hypothetical protein [Paenibacillus sp. GCM10027626]|uniref:hypothetical protein n=1 Tax=Paenibacillus sp. GCM10027626 TaxID=3273411 RepID=UPI00363AD13D